MPPAPATAPTTPASLPAVLVTPSPVARLPLANQAPSNSGDQGDLLPPGWISVIDANSGRPIWIHPESNRVVFNRIDMYLKLAPSSLPAAVPAPAPTPPTTTPDDVPSLPSPLAIFFGKSLGGATRATTLVLSSSSEEQSESESEEEEEASVDFVDATQTTMTAAHAIVQLNQASDNNTDNDDNNNDDKLDSN